MGLAERRVAKEFQDTLFPGFKKEIDQALGFDIPVEVNWESLCEEGSSHLYLECWPKVYFLPLLDALKSVGSDNMGKEALKATLKKIVIQNLNGNSSYSGYSFSDGILVLDHKGTTNVDFHEDRKKNIIEALEKSL
jgi:hypothetical protein